MRSFRLKLHRKAQVTNVTFVGGDGMLRCAGWGSLFQSRLSAAMAGVTHLLSGTSISVLSLLKDWPCATREAPAGHEVAHVTGSRSRDLYLPVGPLDLTPQGANGPGSLPAGSSQPTCHSLHNSYGFWMLKQKVSAWLYLRAQ